MIDFDKRGQHNIQRFQAQQKNENDKIVMKTFKA